MVLDRGGRYLKVWSGLEVVFKLVYLCGRWRAFFVFVVCSFLECFYMLVGFF